MPWIHTAIVGTPMFDTDICACTQHFRGEHVLQFDESLQLSIPDLDRHKRSPLVDTGMVCSAQHTGVGDGWTPSLTVTVSLDLSSPPSQVSASAIQMY
jgi:hypothetical protein